MSRRMRMSNLYLINISYSYSKKKILIYPMVDASTAIVDDSETVRVCLFYLNNTTLIFTTFFFIHMYFSTFK